MVLGSVEKQVRRLEAETELLDALTKRKRLIQELKHALLEVCVYLCFNSRCFFSFDSTKNLLDHVLKLGTILAFFR